jgi:hypothetical protein
MTALGPMREETNAWYQRIYIQPKHAACDGGGRHRNLMMTMAMDLSAKRGVPREMPLIRTS